MSNEQEQQVFIIEKKYGEKLKQWMGCPVLTMTPEICETVGFDKKKASSRLCAVTDDPEGLHTVMSALVLSEAYGWDDETVMTAMLINHRYEAKDAPAKFKEAMERAEPDDKEPGQ